MTPRERALLRYTILCKCRHVSTLTILECIERGATTMREVERRCGAHTGDCQGVRCGEGIERLFRQVAEESSRLDSPSPPA